MHAYINNGIGTLTDLLSDYIVVKRVLGREDDNFLLLLRRGNLLRSSKLVLLIHWDDILSDSWNSSSSVSRWGFLWPGHVTHSFQRRFWTNAICCWKNSCILLLIVLISGLASLNDCSFNISISCSLICNCNLVLESRNPKCTSVRCSSRWSLSLIFRCAWLEEEVIYYHLSLVHIHWWNRCLVGPIRSTFGEHLSLLFL